MGALDGRVAVITGAGRGLGREHALLFAAEGARVVVNDLGGGPDGSGSDASPAQQVAAEIRAAGGQAVASTSDITTAEGADALVRQAIDEFGALHVLVNNAGILRDRTIVNMTDAELATAGCPIRGRVFFVAGGGVHLFQPFALVDGITKDGTWTVAELQEKAARLADVPFELGRIPL